MSSVESASMLLENIYNPGGLYYRGSTLAHFTVSLKYLLTVETPWGPSTDVWNPLTTLRPLLTGYRPLLLPSGDVLLSINPLCRPFPHPLRCAAYMYPAERAKRPPVSRPEWVHR